MSLTEQKNKQIIDAAIAEFQERGFAGASMDRISDRAQVSKRTVYNHFESKEALFHAINNCMLDRIQLSMDITFDPESPIREELKRLGWSQGAVLTEPCAMNMARMFLGEILRDPATAERMSRRLDMVRMVKRFLDGAVQAGALKIDDTWVAAEQFISLIKGRTFFPNLFEGKIATKAEMSAVIDETVDMFLRCYSADAQKVRVAEEA